MKKGLIVLAVMLLVLVTGCTSSKEEKMVCTRTSTMNGIKLNLNYQVYYQKDVVNKVQTTEKITSTSKETLATYKKAVEDLYSNFNGIKHYNYDIAIEGDTLTSKTDINYSKININDLLKIDSSIEQLLNKDNKISLEKIKEVYESTGAICK